MKNITISQNKWAATGALLAMIAVIAGAFGAHLLEHKLQDGKLQVFDTAVRYQMYHALAILVVSLFELKRSKVINWLFLFGIILFSGGLYAYSLSYLFYEFGLPVFGIFAPFGGLCFILAWLIGALGLLSKK